MDCRVSCVCFNLTAAKGCELARCSAMSLSPWQRSCREIVMACSLSNVIERHVSPAAPRRRNGASANGMVHATKNSPIQRKLASCLLTNTHDYSVHIMVFKACRAEVLVLRVLRLRERNRGPKHNLEVQLYLGDAVERYSSGTLHTDASYTVNPGVPFS